MVIMIILLFFVVSAIVAIVLAYQVGYSTAVEYTQFVSRERQLKLIEIYENHLKHKDDYILKLTEDLDKLKQKGKQ